MSAIFFVKKTTFAFFVTSIFFKMLELQQAQAELNDAEKKKIDAQLKIQMALETPPNIIFSEHIKLSEPSFDSKFVVVF